LSTVTSTSTATTTSPAAVSGRTWIAFGELGAVGSIHEIRGGYFYRLLSDQDYRGVFPTLEAAKGALHSAMRPGSERPDFREH
jgi:hypothetical protein